MGLSSRERAVQNWNGGWPVTIFYNFQKEYLHEFGWDNAKLMKKTDMTLSLDTFIYVEF